MSIQKKRIILCGMGTVGKAFTRLLSERRGHIIEKYGLQLDLVAAVDLGGAAVSEHEALRLKDLMRHIEAGNPVETFSTYGRTGVSGADVMSSLPAEVMVETTPTNLDHGEPGYGHMVAALEKGMDVVSANKGPLVLFYRELMDRAKAKGGRIYMSAATAAALPTLDVGLLCLAGATILSVEGILNGTSNYILTRMQIEKCEYQTALEAAQEMGIAETDPSYDVEGFDTRNKLVIIANRVLNQNVRLNDVYTEGISGITPEELEKAATADAVIKLVGTAATGNDGKLALSVAPKALALDHPLAAINYAEKGVSFLTDTMGRVTVSGGKSSPVGAAAALLKDLVHTSEHSF